MLTVRRLEKHAYIYITGKKTNQVQGRGRYRSEEVWGGGGGRNWRLIATEWIDVCPATPWSNLTDGCL